MLKTMIHIAYYFFLQRKAKVVFSSRFPDIELIITGIGNWDLNVKRAEMKDGCTNAEKYLIISIGGEN